MARRLRCRNHFRTQKRKVMLRGCKACCVFRHTFFQYTSSTWHVHLFLVGNRDETVSVSELPKLFCTDSSSRFKSRSTPTRTRNGGLLEASSSFQVGKPRETGKQKFSMTLTSILLGFYVSQCFLSSMEKIKNTGMKECIARWWRLRTKGIGPLWDAHNDLAIRF